MKIQEKILLDRAGLEKYGPITIVALGDSVTHGALRDEMDYESVYWNRLKRKINQVRDFVPVNVINAGIGGTTAKDALGRLDRQVLNHDPDLVIVSFGLNDCTLGDENLEKYADALRQIFTRCKEIGAEVIFLTQNYACTKVKMTDLFLVNIANDLVEMQNSGRLGRFFACAKEVCGE